MMFADYFTIKLGETTVRGKRLTLKEIREHSMMLASGNLSVEDSVKIIESHVTALDGEQIDALDLTEAQLRKLIGELVLPEKGRELSDFIALFS